MKEKKNVYAEFLRKFYTCKTFIMIAINKFIASFIH